MDHKSEWVKNAPQVIAHRGASAYAPENTMSAFRKAFNMRADAIELDTKLLKDGSVIVLHDNNLVRTTNGIGSVYDYSYEEISNLDAGSHFSPQFCDERIPRLETVFNQIGEDLLINVELTNYAYPWDRLPLEVIKLVRSYGLDNRVLLSSFNPWALIAARRIEASIPRALLVHPRAPKVVRLILRKLIDHAVYHPHESMVSKSMISNANKSKKCINVWTVNERSRMVELVRLGVDGIITDFPDIARDVFMGIRNEG
jgi:glycerophosphoryl diester phosphodiesterase